MRRTARLQKGLQKCCHCQMLQKHQSQETKNSIRPDVQALKKRGLTLGESSYVELPFSPEGERVRFLL